MGVTGECANGRRQTGKKDKGLRVERRRRRPGGEAEECGRGEEGWRTLRVLMPVMCQISHSCRSRLRSVSTKREAYHRVVGASLFSTAANERGKTNKLSINIATPLLQFKINGKLFRPLTEKWNKLETRGIRRARPVSGLFPRAPAISSGGTAPGE